MNTHLVRVWTDVFFSGANAYNLCVKPDVMAHACNPSVGRLRQEGGQFETSLGSIVRPGFLQDR